MKQALFSILLSIISISAMAQGQYDWEAVTGGRATTMQLLSVQNDLFVGYLWGKDRYAYSRDQGNTWTEIAEKTGGDRLRFKQVVTTSTGFYVLYDWKKLYLYEFTSGEFSLILDEQRSINDLIVEGGSLFYLQNNTLHTLPHGAVTPIASTHSDYTELRRYDGNILLRNSQDSLLKVVDQSMNTVVAEQPIDLSRLQSLETFENKLYYFEIDELMESEDLGQTWSIAHTFTQGWEFKFSGGTIASLGQDECSVFDLRTKQISGVFDIQTESLYYLLSIYNANGTIFLYDPGVDKHFKVDQNGFTALATNIDNPSTVRVIAIDENAAFFEFDKSFSYIAADQAWISTQNYKDVYFNNQGDLIASLNDSIYISRDRGSSFTKTDYAITGRIRPDTNGRLFIFNEDYYFISDDDGYTWDNDNRRNYFSHFALHLEGLYHIFPIDDDLYGLSESANVLKMGNSAATQHADFPYNGNQDYRSFVVDSDTNPYALYYETFGSTEAILIHKLGDEDEETQILPIQAREMYIDKKDRLFLHDYNQVLMSIDKAESWIDITGNLPDSVRITWLDISDDGTVYISSSQTDAYKLHLDQVSSTSESHVYDNAELALYPSPASDRLFVETISSEVNQYCIFDLQGKFVQEGSLNSTKEALDVSSLQPGIYILKLSGINHSAVGKFIKK